MQSFIKKYYPVFINIYTVWMLYLLFFVSFRSTNYKFTIKTKPFETIMAYITQVVNYDIPSVIENVFGNVILFIPYGFLGLLYPKLNKFGYFLVAFFILINIIEFSQYYFQRGYADVDDVILNTVGAVIGFFIYQTIFRSRKDVAKQFNFQRM